MKERSGHSIRLTWVLILGAAVIVPSCGSSHHGSSGTTPATSSSMNASVSGDGNFVAFDSNDANLVSPSSSGNTREIFLFDRSSGTTKQLTLGQGAAPNGDSSNPRISQDGQWVAFQSTASNLTGTTTATTSGTTAGTTATTTTGVATTSTTVGTTAATSTGMTTTAATTTSGTTASTTGASSTPSGHTQIFVTNVSSGQTMLVSGSAGGNFANGNSTNPSISSDGQMIAFESDSTNMTLAGSTSTCGRTNIFVWRMATHQVTLLSNPPGGTEAN